jgi:hypothetical protein
MEKGGGGKVGEQTAKSREAETGEKRAGSRELRAVPNPPAVPAAPKPPIKYRRERTEERAEKRAESREQYRIPLLCLQRQSPHSSTQSLLLRHQSHRWKPRNHLKNGDVSVSISDKCLALYTVPDRVRGDGVKCDLSCSRRSLQL